MSIFTTDDIHSELILGLHPEIQKQRSHDFVELSLGEAWSMKVMAASVDNQTASLKLQLSTQTEKGWYNHRFPITLPKSDFREDQLRALSALEYWELENPEGSLADPSRPKLFYKGQGIIQFNLEQKIKDNGDPIILLVKVYFEGVELVGSGIPGAPRMAEKRYKTVPAVPPSLPPTRVAPTATRKRAAV